MVGRGEVRPWDGNCKGKMALERWRTAFEAVKKRFGEEMPTVTVTEEERRAHFDISAPNDATFRVKRDAKT